MAGFALGVDAGGTKTLAAVADAQGRVAGVGRAGSANYQACGRAGAAEQLRRAVAGALAQAGLEAGALEAACFGVAGADRAVDFGVIRELIAPLAGGLQPRLENDTVVALRAGTPDGVGVALIAGTGSNAIGRSADGRQHQVGGLGRLTGDYGSAGQLAEAAVVAAFKGLDGRGPATELSRRIPEALGLAQLVDIIEFEFYDMPRGPLDLGRLAPVVFEAAAAGDGVARAVLEQAGAEVARAVLVVIEQLFAPGQPVTVVFGGSVFTRGASPVLIESVQRAVRAERPGVRFVRLAVEPVLGAVGFAFDDAGWPAGKAVWQRLCASFGARTAEGT